MFTAGTVGYVTSLLAVEASRVAGLCLSGGAPNPGTREARRPPPGYSFIHYKEKAMTDSTYDDASRKAYLSSGQVLNAFHKSTQCYGEFCPVHNPSDHLYRDLPLFFDPVGFYFYREAGNGATYVDPDDFTLTSKGKIIIRNAVICLECEDEIESKHRHDFVSCKCGGVAVDGGAAYLRRAGVAGFRDMSVVCTPENLVIQL